MQHLLKLILVNVFLLAIMVSLLVIGLRPQDWEVSRDDDYDRGFRFFVGDFLHPSHHHTRN